MKARRQFFEKFGKLCRYNQKNRDHPTIPPIEPIDRVVELDYHVTQTIQPTQRARSMAIRNPLRLVAYYRQSTTKQEQSGLGMKAQVAAVKQWAASRGGRIMASFTETESGRKRIDQRPQLAAAIQYAKMIGGRLVVAKLDRLVRNVSVLSALRDTKVDFVCCDYEDATPMVIGFLALIAEQEVENTRNRTRASLAAHKADGGKLGTQHPNNYAVLCGPNHRANTRKGGLASVAARRSASADQVRNLGAYVIQLHEQGLDFAEIATKLDAAGFQTLLHRRFTRQNVYHLYNKAKAVDAVSPLPRNEFIGNAPQWNLDENTMPSEPASA
jgi:DNA invertase Pin-like site-specific DNA recombinase